MTTLPRLPSTATNEEIINYVRHYYPNLGPLLRQMLSRFEDPWSAPEIQDQLIELEQELFDLKERRMILGHCPHCGSKI